MLASDRSLHKLDRQQLNPHSGTNNRIETLQNVTFTPPHLGKPPATGSDICALQCSGTAHVFWYWWNAETMHNRRIAQVLSTSSGIGNIRIDGCTNAEISKIVILSVFCDRDGGDDRDGRGDRAGRGDHDGGVDRDRNSHIHISHRPKSMSCGSKSFTHRHTPHLTDSPCKVQPKVRLNEADHLHTDARFACRTAVASRRKSVFRSSKPHPHKKRFAENTHLPSPNREYVSKQHTTSAQTYASPERAVRHKNAKNECSREVARCLYV